MFSFLTNLIKRAKKDSRDLEQVIFDIAEHNREADFHLFYRLMLTREVYLPINKASLPTAAEPGVPYVLQEADNYEDVMVTTVSIANNGSWIPAFTQPAHPILADGCMKMTWLGFLKMAQNTTLQGAFIQGEKSWLALRKEHIPGVLGYSQYLQGVNDWFVGAPPDYKEGNTSWFSGHISDALGYSQTPSGANDGRATVPPGHKVVGISPSTQPQVRHLESNFLVMDFGVDSDWRVLVSGFNERLGRIDVPPTVAILQGAMLDRLRAAGELQDFVGAWQYLRERGWQAVWVLPREAAGQMDAVESLKMAGFGVHGSAEDGMCFVEVHKPDGTIAIGMPGPSL